MYVCGYVGLKTLSCSVCVFSVITKIRSISDVFTFNDNICKCIIYECIHVFICKLKFLIVKYMRNFCKLSSDEF